MAVVRSRLSVGTTALVHMTGMFENAVSRLEAIALRLEATEARLGKGGGSRTVQAAPAASAQPQSPPLLSHLQQPQQVQSRQPPSGCSITSPTAPNLSASTAAYDQQVIAALTEFVEAAKDLGEGVKAPTAIVEAAFQAQRSIVAAMAVCSQPDSAGVVALVQPLASHIGAATALADDRKCAALQHCKIAAESIMGLSWPVYSGPACGMNPPPQHVTDAWSSSEFWANKLLVQHRNSDTGKGHVEWVRALKALMAALSDYLRMYHATGPSWNAQGKTLASYADGRASKPPPPQQSNTPADNSPSPREINAAAKKPPPPPPLPAGGRGSLMDQASPPASGDSSGGDSLLAALNKGDSVTSGLRKVTDSMKAKNREDRSGAVPSTVPAGRGSGQVGAVGASSCGPPKKPPRFELEGGRKWVIENQVGNRELSVEITDPKQTVYVYNCSGCIIQVTGKVNAITVDGCDKTGLVFESAVASVEAVNSRSLQVQCTGVVPTVAIDKVDGCQVFLSESSLGTAILTAKSSEVNIVTPGETAEDDPREAPIPEQFKSSYIDGLWVTAPVTYSGA